MKKTFLVLSLITLVAFGAAAQKARVGLKGGLNFANLDKADDPNGRTGYHFGLYSEFGGAGISVMPEILFSAKGTDDVNLNYIEVPILIKKSFAKVLNIHLGPQFGFLMKADEVDGIDYKEVFKGSDISAVFGVGVDLPKGLTGGVRYVLGLNDIGDNDAIFEGKTVKSKTFQVYIGYKLFGK